MPDNHEFYKTLGVSKSATADEIRKAYKKLARKYHPDVAQDDPAAAEKFKEVQTAYDVLGDEEKRKQYDQFGANFRGGPQGQPFNWGGRGGAQVNPADLEQMFGGQVDLGSLFGGMFGGGGGGPMGGRGRRAQKGADAQVEITVPFQTAVEGGEYPLHLQRDGKPEHLTVKVPAGVDTGSVIRLAGQGQPGAGGGPAGDMLVTIRVAPHPYFRREGNNLLLDLPLTVTEAALGAKIDVPTLSEGRVTLKVPPGTSSGAKLRLREKGVIDRGTKKRGDQFVVVKIVIPQNVTGRTEELLKELAEAAPQSPRAGLW